MEGMPVRGKLYLETTILSYLAARPSRDLIVAAHQQLTHQWWSDHRHEFELFTSQVVLQEVSAGDPEVSTRRLELLADTQLLRTTSEAEALAEELVLQGALPEKAAEDAAHIAIATTNGMDFVLTWNCKHIANARLLRAIQEVCLEQGFELPIICTPEELMGG